jgi:hypothetical protein
MAVVFASTATRTETGLATVYRQMIEQLRADHPASLELLQTLAFCRQ